MIKGIFWYFIAITLILALLDERLSPRGAFPVTAGWIGTFVLYYVLRSSWRFPSWRRLSWRWTNWRWCRCLQKSGLRASWVLDLVVVSALLMLTGGWASPLYLLYLGWAVALIGEAPTSSRLSLTGIVGTLFLLGCLPSLHSSLLPGQIMVMTEQILLLLAASLSVGMMSMYIQRLKYAWEMDRERWDSLREALFAQLSHELYTPLSAVNASALLLAAPDAALHPEQQRRLAQVIQRNCAWMSILTDDLLLMWRKGHQQPEITLMPVDCLAVAEAIAQTLSPLLDARQQRLLIQTAQSDAVALADQRRLEQVLMNLVANAQKYAPAGTTITLTMTKQSGDVLFALHDEGTGMPFEEQGHLFDLFYQGANSGVFSRGSGIGLALARALVVEEGGRIWVESAPGRGSTFYFTLPAVGLE